MPVVHRVSTSSACQIPYSKMSEGEKDQALVPIIALPQGYTTSSYLKPALPKIKGLAVKCKKSNGNPTLDAEVRGYLTFLQTFLPWLETDAVMTPAIRRESLIDKALQVLFDPLYKCPPEIAKRAERIYNKFEDEQWGQDNDVPAVAPEDSMSTALLTGPGTTTGIIRTDDMYQLARPPPPEHPIWGTNGIMHGFIIQSSPHRKFNYVLDPRCESEKRPFKEFGHNGLTPGDWWPYQKVALFHGAHGHRWREYPDMPSAEHGLWWCPARPSTRTWTATWATPSGTAAIKATTTLIPRTSCTGATWRLVCMRLSPTGILYASCDLAGEAASRLPAAFGMTASIR